MAWREKINSNQLRGGLWCHLSPRSNSKTNILKELYFLKKKFGKNLVKLGTVRWLQDKKSTPNNYNWAFEAAWAKRQTSNLEIYFLVKILRNWVLFCGSKVKNQLQPTPTGPLKPFFAYFWRTSKAFSWRFMSRKLSFLTQLHSANTIPAAKKGPGRAITVWTYHQRK